MKKIKDSSGWVRAAVCCFILFMQYGLRDSLLMALPTIAASEDHSGPEDDNITTTTYLPENFTTDEVDTSTPAASESIINLKSNKSPYYEIYDLSVSDLPHADNNNDNDKVDIESEDYDNEREASERYYEFERRENVANKNDASSSGFHPLSLFWEKLKERNIKSPPRNLTGIGDQSSVTLQRQDSDLFNGASGGTEGQKEVFRKIWSYVGMRNGFGEKEHRREFEIDDEYEILLGNTSDNNSSDNFKFQDGWSMLNEGVVLSSVYWGWFISSLLADLIISKLGVTIVMTVSVGISGLLGILTHACSLGGPWVMVPFRIILGAAQGLCYPAITRSLQGVPESSRFYIGSLVFIGPPLGSAAGMGMAFSNSWYVATYVMGSLAVPLIPLCLILPTPKDEDKKVVPVTRLLRSAGVWACLIVFVANIFTYHTAVVGIKFCLTYTDIGLQKTTGVESISVVMGTALVVWIAAAMTLILSGKIQLTVLNKRRIPIAIGSLWMFISLIIMATVDIYGVLIGFTLGGIGLGAALTRFGCRLNLEDIAPWTLPRLLHVINITGVFTAIWPPLLVTGLAKDGDHMWLVIWLIPLALIVPSAVAYMFLLTTNPQPWDENQEGPKTGAGTSNGVGPPRGDTPAARGVRLSFKSARSGLSFKSAQSAQTFKTAMSRRRSRAESFRTVDEDLSVDMRSVIEEEEEEDVHSVQESNNDCKSVASSASFKSDGADMHSIDLNEPEVVVDQERQRAAMFSGSPSDRTSAWLSYHHQVSIDPTGRPPPNPPPPNKAEMRRRNAIYDLFW